MRIALYHPDIPQNAGTILRLCACFGIEAHIIEPAGFPATDRAFRLFIDALMRVRDLSPEDVAQIRERFEALAPGSNLMRESGKILLFGRESAGVPREVHATADARLRIPMRKGLRSLNVAVAAAMAVGEAMRQTKHSAQ